MTSAFQMIHLEQYAPLLPARMEKDLTEITRWEIFVDKLKKGIIWELWCKKVRQLSDVNRIRTLKNTKFLILRFQVNWLICTLTKDRLTADVYQLLKT